MTTPNQHLLVLDDDVALRGPLVRSLLSGRRSVDAVATIAAARSRIFRHPYDAWILDVWLPDGCSLDLLELARKKGVLTPALVLTGDPDPAVERRARAAGADFARKPDVAAVVRAFVARLTVPSDVPPTDVLELRSKEAALSPREHEVLRAASRGLTRAQTAALLGVSENTVKTMLRRIFVKTGARRVAELFERWGIDSPTRSQSE